MRLLTISLVFFIFSCSTKSDNSKQDFQKSENSCEFSQWLRIEERQDSTIIQIIHPDRKKVIERLAFAHNSKSNQKTNIAAFSATHLGMLSVLGEQNSVVAVADEKLVFDPKILNQIKSNKTSSMVAEEQVSIERNLLCKTNYLIYSAFSGDFKNGSRLKKMGVTCIPNFDWRETHPLGRAEWILLFGYLTGKQNVAKEIFKEIVQEYQSIQKKVKRKSKRKVISGNFINDYWYAPAGNSFQAQMFKDAGINYIYENSKGTGSLEMSKEKIVSTTADIQIWLNPGFATKKDILNANPKAKFLPFLSNSKIYCTAKNLNKFWELGAIQPHLILKDYYYIANGINLDHLHFFSPVE
jgi:iron complex transport system substrate-binding protein